MTNTRYNRSKHHFCSNQCSNAFRNKDTHEIRKCKICGKEFDCLKSSTKIFCSPVCQSIWQKDAPHGGDNKRLLPIVSKGSKNVRETRPKIEYHCDYCGKSFIKSEGRVRGLHAFCCYECFLKWSASDLNPRHTAKEVTCDYCGKNFITSGARYNKNIHNYCCKECADKDKANTYADYNREKASKRIISNLRKGIYSTVNTKPQITVNNLLDELRILYTNEYSVYNFSIDNYLNEYNLFIEVMGTFWHSDPTKYTEMKYDAQFRSCIRDTRKRKYIFNSLGVNVLSLWEEDIENDIDKCRELILYYINNNGVIDNYNSFNYELKDGALQLKQDIVLPFYEREEYIKDIA